MTAFGGCVCHARAGGSLAPTPGLRRVRSGLTSDASGVRRRDPTGTYKLRRAFMAEFTSRFAALRRLTSELLIRRDDLGLGRYPTLGALNAGADPAAKLEAFNRWFGNSAKTVVAGYDARWVEPYLTSAYRMGAWAAARHLGPDVRPPMDPRRIATYVVMAMSEVDGLVDEVERQVARAAGAAIAAGATPGAVVRAVWGRIEKIGVVRAQALVNTAVVAAHAQASLDTYAQAGVARVGVVPEYVPRRRRLKDALSLRRIARLAERQVVEITTAGDDLVCDTCQDLEDSNPYTIPEAIGLIPAHPNCRCAWVPAGEFEFDGFGDAGKGNPYHVGSGEKGGQFTTGGGGGGPAPKKVLKKTTGPSGTKWAKKAVMPPVSESTTYGAHGGIGPMKQAVADYTTGDHWGINNYLRGVMTLEEAQANVLATGSQETPIPEIIGWLDKFLEQQPRTEKDQVVYRAVASELYDKIAAGGGEIEDRGFTSTTMDRNTLKDRESASKEKIMEVLIPRGSMAAPISHLGDWTEEAELLVARGGVYKVVKTATGIQLRLRKHSNE